MAIRETVLPEIISYQKLSHVENLSMLKNKPGKGGRVRGEGTSLTTG